ncbi:MAG TPA: ABC transporter permease [Blastocatellia bacterium]|nr:ABC transporter permease [Blastocatellia bacterium]
MNSLLNDLRYGTRVLRKRPGFAAVVILTLALGIGANTAIFSVINAVLLRALPYPQSERLVVLFETSKEVPTMAVPFPDYLDWRARQTVFEDVAARMPVGGILTGEGEPERIIGRLVTASFFSTLGVRPRLGRFFDEAEDQPGGERVIVIGYDLWQRRFGGDENVIGHALRYNNESWTVIGVMPANFDFYGTTNPNNDFCMPIGQMANVEYMRDRNSHTVTAIGRLRAGVGLEQADAEMQTIAAQLAEAHPESNTGTGVGLRSFLDDYVGDVRPALLIIMAAVALVLAVACVNVANLLLARAASRQKEIAVRLALGAGRWRIIRQLLTESLVLALIGGALGLLLAGWGIDLLLKLHPDALPRLEQVSIDPRVLGFTLFVTLITGVIFGLAPALQATRVDLHDALKEGGRTASFGTGGKRLRAALVVTEIALALILLISAGLLLVSFKRLMQVDPGFDPKNVLTTRLRLPDAKYPEAAQTNGFLREVMSRVAALPGVERVCVTTGFPLRPQSEYAYWLEGQPEPQQQQEWPAAIMQSASEGYHDALGIRLLAGRLLTEHDDASSPLVVLVDEAFVARHFPNGDFSSALGHRLRFGGEPGRWYEIVGVVRHVRAETLAEEGRAIIYRPWQQISPKWLANRSRAMDLVVRASVPPESLVAAIRQEVQSIDRDQPLANVRTLGLLYDEQLAPHRFSLLLLGLFAGVAMLLAMIGIYGVMSYAVTQRTREIGIRMALGAARHDIFKQVVGHALLLTAGGIIAGLMAAAVLTRLMASLLFSVEAIHWPTFLLTALLLTGVALLASYLPARRATKVDPMIALRYE